jgi:hypothetical protein
MKQGHDIRVLSPFGSAFGFIVFGLSNGIASKTTGDVQACALTDNGGVKC